MSTSAMPHQSPDREGGIASEKPVNVGMAAAGTAAGLGAGALLMAVLQNYPGVIPQMLNWGPTLLILAGFAWMANQHLPRFFSSQELIGNSLQRLASTVERDSNSTQDLVLRMQVNSDKLDEVRGVL